MKFCEECGAQLEDDAVFCEECGSKVELADTGNGMNVTPELAETESKVHENAEMLSTKQHAKVSKGKSGKAIGSLNKVCDKKVMPFILGGVALLIVVILLIALLGGKDDSTLTGDEDESSSVTTENLQSDETDSQMSLESEEISEDSSFEVVEKTNYTEEELYTIEWGKERGLDVTSSFLYYKCLQDNHSESYYGYDYNFYDIDMDGRVELLVDDEDIHVYAMVGDNTLIKLGTMDGFSFFNETIYYGQLSIEEEQVKVPCMIASYEDVMASDYYHNDFYVLNDYNLEEYLYISEDSNEPDICTVTYAASGEWEMWSRDMAIEYVNKYIGTLYEISFEYDESDVGFYGE